MSKLHSSLRLTSTFFVFLFFYLTILINLFVIQIKNAAFYKSLGDHQYKIIVNSKPERAEIYDRNDKPLAINKEGLSAFLIPKQIKESEKVNDFLAINFPQAYIRLEKNKNNNFFYIKRKLKEDQINLIKESDLSDIKLLKEPSRYYPIEAAASVVGITNIDNQGILGLEQVYNKELEGKSSIYVLCKDARSGYFHFKKEKKIKGSKAKPIKTTLDSVLQFLVSEELKSAVEALEAKAGSVLILDPNKGDIIVMANYPFFDPNNTENLNLEATKNRIVVDAYEMGSVIKVFLALSALEEGIFCLQDEIDCENKRNYKLNGVSFSTVKPHGVLTFSQVIELSNNIGVAKVAQLLGKKLYDNYKKLGFGEKINIFLGENPGFMTPPNRWSNASLISLSFGYEISMNLLQLAQAFTVIANDGYLVKPKIIYDQEPKKIGPIFKAETVRDVKKILRRTIKRGTAKKAAIKGYNVMGKTGTARLLTDGKYDRNRLIFTFVGIVEKSDYKRIILTFIQETKKTEGVYASTIAAPLFEKIAQKMLIHDKIL